MGACTAGDSPRPTGGKLIVRSGHGEIVAMPLDLSEVARASFERWPTRLEPREREAFASLKFEEFETTEITRGVVVIRFALRGIASDVVMDVRSERCAYVRFLRGVQP